MTAGDEFVIFDDDASVITASLVDSWISISDGVPILRARTEPVQALDHYAGRWLKKNPGRGQTCDCQCAG